MTRQSAYRKYKVKRDATLRLQPSKKVITIKKNRSTFRTKQKKQLERLEQRVRSKGDNRLQDKLTTNQLRRKNKQVKRNIAKRKKLRYKREGGDIALGKSIDPEKGIENFYSSNVWKFKIRGKNLMVSFLDGSVYIYWGAAKLFLGMTRTSSKGKYVGRNLIRKDIAYTKIK